MPYKPAFLRGVPLAETKTCTQCKVEFPYSQFSRGTNRHGYPKISSWCKACTAHRLKLEFGRDWRRDLLAHSKRRAIGYGIPHTISIDDIVIPTHCPALGIPIARGMGKSRDGSPSLDRIIPEKGYVPGNIVVVSYKANAMKRNGTIEELISLASFYMSFKEPK